MVSLLGIVSLLFSGKVVLAMVRGFKRTRERLYNLYLIGEDFRIRLEEEGGMCKQCGFYWGGLPLLLWEARVVGRRNTSV